MTLEEFRGWLTEREPALKAWGAHVVRKIQERVNAEIGEKRGETFFKVGPLFRVKDPESAAKKQATKNYEHPHEQMTDLVGARFVVLLRSDISIVQNAIADYPGWTISLDRDPEFEVSNEPLVFDYQSLHYVLSCPADEEFGGVLVPAGTTCEVQIRTLLQHAYAEVVHDNVYKSSGPVPPQTRRVIARSMAFIESADELFCRALEQLANVNTAQEAWLGELSSIAERLHGQRADAVADLRTVEFLDTFREHLSLADRRDIRALADEAAISQLIKRRAGRGGLFQMPICILVYWLAERHARDLVRHWPFPDLEGDRNLVMADMGKSAIR